MNKIIILILIISILILGLFFLLRAQKEELQNQPKPEFMTPQNKIKPESVSQQTEGETVSIITIYDNYLANPNLKTDWGFSCLLKISSPEKKSEISNGASKNILFDTGADSETLLYNMDKMDINPKEIDTVVISHSHADHTGGLSGFLEANGNQAKVYQPLAFSKPTKIYNNVYSTGPLGTGVKEQSLVINSSKGLVIITGCAHPGIVDIIKKAKEMFLEKKVYLVLGGFHLFAADDSELRSIINDFRELGVQKAAPCHCSGDRCRELFKKEYGEDFIENGVGMIINI